MQNVYEAMAGIAAGVPKPLLAAVVLVAGFFGSLFAKALATGILRLIRFDSVSAKTGFSEFLRKGQVSYPPSSLIGILAYWAVLVWALFQISRILDIAIVNAVFDQAVEIVPKLLAALLVSLIGSIIVSFFAKFALTLAGNAALPNARLLSRLIKYGGNILVILIALDQVGLGRSVINSMFVIFFGALMLALALAFGLGCKDIARDAFARFQRTLRERNERGTDLEG